MFWKTVGMLFLTAEMLLAAENWTVNASGRVNIRRGPSASEKVIGKLQPGDTVQVRNIRDGWAELDGNKGFVSASLLVRASDKKESSSGTAAPKTSSQTASVSSSGSTVGGPSGQPFPDLPVVAGKRREVTVSGLLHPIQTKIRVKYAILKEAQGKYRQECFVYVFPKDAAKFKILSGKEVKAVGVYYTVDGWKKPVMFIRSLKAINPVL